ncbi:MAG TPA: monovalent cation/H(+) antiporter subunit G [Acetobacteraceae bacterium]|nr:monovalent cation/H(+) antiporter subunit G [Acetobacteraceae bacterium]
MIAILISAALGIAVLATWLGCAGFARLTSPYARLHCVPFVTAAAGVPIVIAAFLADGASDRAGKILLLLAVALLGGAALSHAAGRAFAMHDMNPEDP